MLINVSQLLKAPIGSTKNYTVSQVIEEIGNHSLVEGKVELMRTPRSILVRGTLHTEIELTCSRCLSLFTLPLAMDIEEEYFPTTDIVTGSPVALPDEPGCFTIDKHNILDLTEAIRQYALLAIPMKPLCRQDCAGLCPTCGYNLNESNCGCPPKLADPRWSKLLKLALAKDKVASKPKGMN